MKELLKLLGVGDLTPELAGVLVEAFDAELTAIGNGERGERIEHESSQRGRRARSLKWKGVSHDAIPR